MEVWIDKMIHWLAGSEEIFENRTDITTICIERLKYDLNHYKISLIFLKDAVYFVETVTLHN
jgi:hypothetical protein